MCTGFPYAGTENSDAVFSKLGSGFEYLLFGLGAAGTGDEDGTGFGSAGNAQWFKFHFVYIKFLVK